MTNRAAQRQMNDIATVWPNAGTDDFGFPSYGDPYTISCNIFDGGKLTKDEKGDEFMPMQTIRTLDTAPQKDDLIIAGDFTIVGTHSGTGAQRIRKRRTVTNFRGVQQSTALLTSA
jgi:hypothetical protein